jgi:hypothetical protein
MKEEEVKISTCYISNIFSKTVFDCKQPNKGSGAIRSRIIIKENAGNLQAFREEKP